MANDDYGYFGKGSTGYDQYMTAFNRSFGGCGFLIAIAVIVVLILIGS